MRNRLELPVYTAYSGRIGESFQYVRISDVKDESIKSKFNDFMKGQTMPLIQLEKEYLTDAVFYWDYTNFLNHLDGKQVFID